MPRLLPGSAAREAQQTASPPMARPRLENAGPDGRRAGRLRLPEAPLPGRGREALRLPHPPRSQSTAGTQTELIGRAGVSQD